MLIFLLFFNEVDSLITELGNKKFKNREVAESKLKNKDYVVVSYLKDKIKCQTDLEIIKRIERIVEYHYQIDLEDFPCIFQLYSEERVKIAHPITLFDIYKQTLNAPSTYYDKETAVLAAKNYCRFLLENGMDKQELIDYLKRMQKRNKHFFK